MGIIHIHTTPQHNMPKTARKLDFENASADVTSTKIQKTDDAVDKSWARIESLLKPVSSKKPSKLPLFGFVKPMLAKPSKSVKEVLPAAGVEVTCEWKYDGERVQIHMESVDDKLKVKLFSRNGHESTGR